MAYYAKLDENNIVLAVHIISNEITTIDGIELEQRGVDFLTELYGYPLWKQTSYNTQAGEHAEGKKAFRKNYAGIGFIYDEERDAFIPPKPFPSWILDEQTCRWQAPVPRPDDIDLCFWNEENQEWVEHPVSE